jgi:hypothetical protein
VSALVAKRLAESLNVSKRLVSVKFTFFREEVSMKIIDVSDNLQKLNLHNTFLSIKLLKLLAIKNNYIFITGNQKKKNK